jgi:hypothetical protein
VSETHPNSTERARRLAEQARISGALELPELTDAELFALGIAHLPVLERDLLGSWAELEAEQQRALRAVAFGFLRHRNLIEPQAAADGLSRCRPELGFILAARIRPGYLVLCEPTDSSAQLRLYGLAETGDPDGCAALAVAEQLTGRELDPLGRVHRFTLLGTRGAAERIGHWALKVAEVRRCADIFRHTAAGGLSRERFAIGPGPTADAPGLVHVELTRPGTGQVVAVDCPAAEVLGALTASLGGL